MANKKNKSPKVPAPVVATPAPIDNSKKSMKRQEALFKYHHMLNSKNSIIQQLKGLESEAMRLQSDAQMHDGAAKILFDIFQFSQAELATVPASPTEEVAEAEEPKYD